jgi:hypothetical protein
MPHYSGSIFISNSPGDCYRRLGDEVCFYPACRLVVGTLAASVWPVGTDGDIANEDVRAGCRPEDPQPASKTVKRLKKRNGIEFVAVFRSGFSTCRGSSRNPAAICRLF